MRKEKKDTKEDAENGEGKEGESKEHNEANGRDNGAQNTRAGGEIKRSRKARKR